MNKTNTYNLGSELGQTIADFEQDSDSKKMVKSLFEIMEINAKNIFRPKVTAKSERAELISKFVEEINKERIGTKFKPVTGKQIAIQLAHLNLASLYTFLSLAKDYKNRQGAFGKYYYGVLKLK